MTRTALEVAAEFFEPMFGGEADVVKTVEEDALWVGAERQMDPAAPIGFITGDGLQMTGGSEFRGIPGYRAGWREWVAPWDQFRVTIEEAREVDPETVLVLVRTTSRLEGSEMEVSQGSAAVMTIRDGRIVAMDHYLDQELAIREAGGDG